MEIGCGRCRRAGDGSGMGDVGGDEEMKGLGIELYRLNGHTRYQADY